MSLRKSAFQLLRMQLNAYVWINKLSIRTRTKVISRKHIIQLTGFGAYSSTWARFLSLSQTVLRNCLSQDSSETGLRSLVVSVFYICLRQKIVLQIQIQVLVNTLAPIKYLIFLKNPVIKWNFMFTKCILILGTYCSMIEPKIFVWLFVTQA